MTDKKLGKLIRRWQARLRLQDWQIYFKQVKKIDGEKETLADIETHVFRREAYIRVATGSRPRRNRHYDPERSVVHELLHIHMAGLGRASDRNEIAEEQAVHSVSVALLKGWRK